MQIVERIKARISLFFTYVKVVWSLKFDDPERFMEEFADRWNAYAKINKKTIK
jgi:hypothetical protein